MALQQLGIAERDWQSHNVHDILLPNTDLLQLFHRKLSIIRMVRMGILIPRKIRVRRTLIVPVHGRIVQTGRGTRGSLGPHLVDTAVAHRILERRRRFVREPMEQHLNVVHQHLAIVEILDPEIIEVVFLHILQPLPGGIVALQIVVQRLVILLQPRFVERGDPLLDIQPFP